MYSMNQLTIIGFTGNDAEAHYTTSGALVVTISVATKESWKGRRRQLAEQNRLAPDCFFWQAGRVHAYADQRIVCDGAGRNPHA